MKITELIKKQRVYLDGGTGTMLQAMGLAPGTPPEQWNLTHPDRVTALHSAYLDAGCDVIATNTFGINPQKYENYAALIESAVGCARKAADAYANRFVAFDIGPTGKLLEPLGELGFEQAVELFSANVRAAVRCGVDLILIETMNDSLETKAAVLAAKENSDLPVFVTNVYDESGKLMTGADPRAMIALLEGLRVDALGMNCSLGPDKMLPLMAQFTAHSSLPIIVKPNAGLPAVRDGKTVYGMDSEVFSDWAEKLAEAGGCILGGCCGTTPEYLAKVIEKTRFLPFALPAKKAETVISSGTHAVEIGTGSPVLIGERINPTGKKKLKEALRQNDLNYLLNEAVRQTDAGVQALDVNVGLPEIDEADMMTRTVQAVQSVSDLPLQIDTSSPAVMEQALRLYNGKALINSVNGKQESMDAILPLAAKYGGTVIALTLDENGIPDTAEGRVEIALRIIGEAAKYGIQKQDIIVDPLTMAVSADKGSALKTLTAVESLRKLGIRTSLGVSNISFGLPERERLNTAFFTAALEKGLDCAIMNPFSPGMMWVFRSYRALHGLDEGFRDYIDSAAGSEASEKPPAAESTATLKTAVIKGLSDGARTAAAALLQTEPPLDIINREIIPALNDVGKGFEEKRIFLPQLLMSAEAAAAAFELVKEKLPKNDDGKGSVILATVKGDIHDIGKNIVRVLLESYGFSVIDLGRDVSPEAILDCAVTRGIKLVGLSALMTTTVPNMAETIRLLKTADPAIRVVVGGAVLNAEYARMIGADHYSADAMNTVRYAEEFYGVK